VRTGEIDLRSVLADTEFEVYKILSHNGPLMTSINLDSHCVGRGISHSRTEQLKTYSPILARYAPSVYGLRGAEFLPGLLTEIRQKLPITANVTQDYGWTSDGRPWIAYKASRGMLNAGVVTIPSAMKPYIVGRFAYSLPEDRLRMGTIVVDENRAWGVGPFLRRYSVEPGDRILVVFDIRSQKAEIHAGETDVSTVTQPFAASNAPVSHLNSSGSAS